MKRLFIAALTLAAAVLFAMPASAAQYDSMTMDVSQTYLRLGFDDAITVNVHLMDHGSPSGEAGVPIAMEFRIGGDYALFDETRITTNGTGEGSAVIRLNMQKQPERLPQRVMIEAVVIGNNAVRAFAIIYITDTGPIWGYVLDDSGSTITGAQITVTTPDGKIFPGGPYKSNEEPPMGHYRIDNLPLLTTGPVTLTASKGGFTGTRQAVPGIEGIRNDITISGYHDRIDVPSIVTGNANATVAPTVTPAESETPTKPTTMTTTILIAIILITLVYIGLKAYRRMF